MNKIVKLLFVGLIVSFVFYSCSKNNDSVVPETTTDTTSTSGTNSISADTIAINKWISESMIQVYLWNDLIPKVNYQKEPNPTAFFYKMLNKPIDRWSFITNDYASLNAEFSGVPETMGYDPAFYRYSNSDKSVFIVIDYVYPGSPAAEAGLKRGDIIVSINNNPLNTSNYYDLYSGKDYNVQLGKKNGTSITKTGESFQLTARVVSADPAIYDTIFNVNDQKIGYLVYVGFVSDNAGAFYTHLDSIFSAFNQANISDLIVDLRYNPGGEIGAAVHLASEIAPASVANDQHVLVNMKYNTGVESFYESDPATYGDRLSFKFTSNVTNANMQRVFLLTTRGTASASELLRSGLDPYMDVVQVGDTTYGKYVGAWVLPDDNEKWAIVPIVMKYSNIDGFTDFKNGIAPDYLIEDDPMMSFQFGDKSDPVVAKAIGLATGTTAVAAKAARVPRYQRIVPDELIRKRNLYIPLNNEKLMP